MIPVAVFVPVVIVVGGNNMTGRSVVVFEDASVESEFTHCILVDSSTVIWWTSPFVILGVSDLLCRFYSIFDGNSC